MNIHDTIAPVNESSARHEAARVGRPYAPGKIESLWDMLRFHAHKFLALMRTLERMKRSVIKLRRMHEISAVTLRTVAPEKYAEVSDKVQAASREMVSEASAKWLSFLDAADEQCRRLKLGSALSHLRRMRKSIGNGSTLPAALEESFNELRRRIKDQFQARLFMFVPAGRAKYYLDNKVFEQAVADKFPSMKEEMDEARMCIAFGRYTAAVFHLMRIMEQAVSRLAKRVRVPKAQVEDKAWGPILDAINARITRLRRSNPRKVLYSEATAHLNHVRAVWRNTTMHPKRTYTYEQAEEILASVKTFINHLVSRLL